MALATMRHGFDEIGAAIPLCVARGARFEALVGIEQQCPYAHQRPLIERKDQCVLRRRRVHGTESEEIRLDRGSVGVGHVGIAGEWHGRIQFCIVAPDAFVHGVQEICVAVIADACFLIRRDIGGVQRAKWQHECAAARIRGTALGRMAGCAVRGTRQVFASLDETRAFQFRRDAGRIRSAIAAQRHLRAAREIHRVRCKHDDP